MGVVRTRVRLANPFDEIRARHGEISQDRVRTYEADAMVDSGAVRMIIPPEVFDRLGLESVSSAVAEYADGRKESVKLTDGMRIEIMGRETTDDALVLGDEILIGQTVLEKLDLLIDCREQRLIPNPAHPDQAVSKVK